MLRVKSKSLWQILERRAPCSPLGLCLPLPIPLNYWQCAISSEASSVEQPCRFEATGILMAVKVAADIMKLRQDRLTKS